MTSSFSFVLSIVYYFAIEKAFNDLFFCWRSGIFNLLTKNKIPSML